MSVFSSFVVHSSQKQRVAASAKHGQEVIIIQCNRTIYKHDPQTLQESKEILLVSHKYLVEFSGCVARRNARRKCGSAAAEDRDDHSFAVGLKGLFILSGQPQRDQ